MALCKGAGLSPTRPELRPKIHAVDDDHDAAARARSLPLIEDNLEWALAVAAAVSRRLPPSITADDLAGAAELALMRSAMRYRPSQFSTPFRQYAGRRIEGACLDLVRDRGYLGSKLYRESTHAPLTDTHVDPAPNPEQAAAAAEQQEHAGQVWVRVAALNPRLADIIRLHFQEGLTLKAIAGRFNISPSRVQQLRTRALAHLRQTCGDLRPVAGALGLVVLSGVIIAGCAAAGCAIIRAVFALEAVR